MNEQVKEEGPVSSMTAAVYFIEQRVAKGAGGEGTPKSENILCQE